MRVLVLFGGRSGEHEVSVSSARPVVDALEALGHDIVSVGICRSGRWVYADPRRADVVGEELERFSLQLDADLSEPDVVFPVMHGPGGEDGSIQGLLEIVDVAYVGAGVEGSAIGVNKVTHKRLFMQAGLPVIDFVSFERNDWADLPDELMARIEKLGYPCFAKPARLGSSVGITKIPQASELPAAVERALRHDDEVLVEAHGYSRELEVGVLGEPPQVSVIGEVIPDGEFYDYRAKYRGEWTELRIPADVPSSTGSTVDDYALRAFRAAKCAGLARVDFFFDPATDDVVVNEINTMPGLTPKSMYPRVWAASGRPFTEVVSTLLDHAVARHQEKHALEATREAAHADEVEG